MQGAYVNVGATNDFALDRCPVNYLPLLAAARVLDLGLGNLSLTPPEAGNTSLCVGCLFRLTETMASFERF